MDRRTFITTAALGGLGVFLSPADLAAMGPDDRFTVGRLNYAPTSNPRPSALRRLLLEVEKRTSILVENSEVAINPGAPELFEQPLVVLGGDRKFDPLPEETVLNIRSYLQAGGLLVVDSAEGVRDGPFMQSVKRELRRVFPDKKISTIPRDHVLYKSFYLIEKPVGRVVVRDVMEGIFDDDRLAVIVSHNDLMGAWARDNFGNWKYQCSPGGERQREFAYRLGINLVMYALCINYKADQVHVPFILRRRQWKVE